MTRALVEVGLPAFNCDDSIGRAIDSLRAQTFVDFKVTVSNNASSDATADAIARHVAGDPRFEIVTQAENIGPYGNYRYLIDRADTPLFAYLPADDWWSPTYLEATADVLLKDEAAVCCVPRAGFHAESGELLYVTPSTSSLAATEPLERAKDFLRHPSDCCRFYGLHRTDLFRRCFEGSAFFHAWDWYVVLREIMGGLHLEVPFNLLHRTTAPPDRYAKYWRAANLTRLIPRTPLQPMRRALKDNLAAADYRALRASLARLDSRLVREHRADERRARAGDARGGHGR